MLSEVLVRRLFPHFDPRRQIAFYENQEGVRLATPNAQMRLATPKGDFEISVQINSFGLRDKKLLSRSQRNIFVLGDSYAFGWGVDESERFSDRLEVLLGQPVYNLAIPGDLFDDERLLFYAERHGASISHLILCICMGNDLRVYPREELLEPSHTDDPRFSFGFFRAWMRSHSAVYLGLSETLQHSAPVKDLLERIGISRNKEALFGMNQFDPEAIESSAAEVASMIHGREATILIIPSPSLWIGTQQENERKVHEAFVARLRAHSLHLIDMKLVLEETRHPLDYYFSSDPHWNARGHDLAAMTLFETMRSSIPK